MRWEGRLVPFAEPERRCELPTHGVWRGAVKLVQAFGLELVRVSGSHHIDSREDIPELVNLQNVDGEAKPYQVRQFLQLVERYDLRLEEDE